MIEITRDNYEMYALDYIEGGLPMDIHIKFEVFLSNNKDIADELATLPDFCEEKEVEFDSKNSLDLKKGAMLSEEINSENCDYYFSAYHEGDLSHNEKQKVDDFLAMNPTLKIDFKQIGLLNFSADETIHYPFKKELKKAVPILWWKRTLRVAAVFILLLSIGIAFFNYPSEKRMYVERVGSGEQMLEQEREQESDVLRDLVVALKEQEDEQGQEAEQEGELTSKLLVVMQEREQQQQQEQEREGEGEGEQVNNMHVDLEKALINEEQLDLVYEATAKEGESESIMEDEFIADVEEIETKTLISDEQNNSDDDAVIASLPEKQQNLSPNTILKFKKPTFKKSDNEEEVLASNQEETLITIANPLKKKSKKGFSLGPLKVKRSGSN